MFGLSGFLLAHYFWPKVKVEKLDASDSHNIVLDSVNYGRLQFVLTKYATGQTALKDVAHYTTINEDSLQVGTLKFVKNESNEL
jgi:hypothetical protein